MTAHVAAGSAESRARRQPPKLWHVPIRRVVRVTPRMLRITVGGDDLADFPAAGTDQNVMLYFYPDGVRLPEPLTLPAVRAEWSRIRPQTRTYTVRRFDPETRELDFDFVLHGEHGLASGWASRARPGDMVIFVGPSPAYRPAPDADWYLLAGDETALPAVAAILRELPAGARVLAYLEVADAGEEQPLPTDSDATISWLHRDGRPAGDNDLLVNAVISAEFPSGEVDAWVAGERSAVQAVRRHLLDERGCPRRRIRPTTYWRRGEPGK